MTETQQQTPEVEFFYDVTCPYAWVTSRWLMEVCEHRELNVRWRPMSLSILNEGRDISADYAESMKKAWVLARAVAGAVFGAGEENSAKIYTEFGTRLHNEGRKNSGEELNDLIEEVYAACGIDLDYYRRAAQGEYDQQLAHSHQAGIDLVGDEVGTPIISLNGVAFFGPVITRIPRGEEAVKLFNASVDLASYPYFYELKRSRTTRPEFD